jgi:hypothetical protein
LLCKSLILRSEFQWEVVASLMNSSHLDRVCPWWSQYSQSWRFFLKLLFLFMSLFICLDCELIMLSLITISCSSRAWICFCRWLILFSISEIWDDSYVILASFDEISLTCWLMMSFNTCLDIFNLYWGKEEYRIKR